MIPMNLMKNKVADYIVTGQWAKKAAKEAEKLCKQKEKEEKERRKREAGPSWIQRKIDSLTKEIFSDDDMK